MQTHYVHDYETLRNCFVAVFRHYKTDEIHVFVVHRLRNNFLAFLEFLDKNRTNNEWHISFNGLAFDSQITQYILENRWYLMKLDPDMIARNISQQAGNVINRSNQGMFSEWPEWKLSIKQIDLFKLNHWDNPAKGASLKWIEYTMDWHNVQEMPIHHDTEIETMEQIEQIISYCINDVDATKEILNRSQNQVKLRGDLTREYGINLFSASEPRISKELFAHFLSERMGMEKKQLKQLRTPREKIVLKDIILPYIKFKTPEFQSVLDFFNSKVIVETKGALAYSIKYKGVKTDYGLGGIHGCRRSGIYRAGNGMIIMTSDVASFYPNLAIENGWSPEHFDPAIFCELYKWFFIERKKIPKTDIRNYVYKIILNSTYGLSNDANSFLYDPEFTMRITINGQLSLSMLYEMLAEGIPGAVPLMQNTDGLEMMIPEEYYDRYLEICAEWEKMTKLVLEHDQYSKMVIGDVNNYIAVNKKGKSKCKGRFEYEDLALHKNKSFLIIPKALHAYFVNGIKPEDYLYQNRNIFDYCAGAKIKGNWYFEARSIKEGEYEVEKLQKLVRYYITKDGEKLIKCNPDGREIQLESGKWLQHVFNRYEERSWQQYGVDENYYLEAIYREINSIDPTVNRAYSQLQLF